MPQVSPDAALVTGLNHAGFMLYSGMNVLVGFLFKLGKVKEVPAAQRNPEQQTVTTSDMRGDRRTLVADSFIPATMALIYLCIVLYFKTIGGYKTVHIKPEEIAGGVEAPVR